MTEMTERAQEFTAKLTALLEEYNASIDVDSDNGVSVDLWVGNEVIALDEPFSCRTELDKDTTYKAGRNY